MTPAFAEYVSGHSAFAAAEVLPRFSGGDRFFDPTVKVGDLNRDHIRDAVGTYVVRRGQGAFERATPQDTVTLRWDTFTAAAKQCSMARLYGGVHIMDANPRGLEMGRMAAKIACRRASALWAGETVAAVQYKIFCSSAVVRAAGSRRIASSSKTSL